MNAQWHRAYTCHAFNQVLLLFGVSFWGKPEFHHYFLHSSGVIGHDLGNIDLGAHQIDAVVHGLDAHDGHDAVAKGGGQKVGGREGLALAAVVGGGVGNNFAARLQVNILGA